MRRGRCGTGRADRPHFPITLRAPDRGGIALERLVGDSPGLRWVAAHTAMVLERGPLTTGIIR